MHSDNPNIHQQQRILDRAADLAIDVELYEIMKTGRRVSRHVTSALNESDVEQALSDARTIIAGSNVQRAICAALQSTSADLKELTKISGAAVLPLLITGVVTIPLTPLVIAAVGVVVYRSGVAAYCSGVTSSNE